MIKDNVKQVQEKVEKVNVKNIQEKTQETAQDLRSTTHEAFRAYLGGWAITADVVRDWSKRVEKEYQQAVKRGEKVEKEMRTRYEKMAKQTRKEVKETGGDVESRIEDVMKRLDVPTRSDIQKLSVQIDALSAKLSHDAKHDAEPAKTPARKVPEVPTSN